MALNKFIAIKMFSMFYIDLIFTDQPNLAVDSVVHATLQSLRAN